MQEQCRCGQPLTGATRRIGVCVYCVAKSTLDPKAAAIPAPAYRGDDGDDAQRHDLPRPD